MSEYLSPTQILAAATEHLAQGGYHEYLDQSWLESGEHSRVFEDPYGVVGVHVYDTWQALEERWHLAQGGLVELISSHFARAESKAWEGYLVLLTPGLADDSQRVSEIRYNTSRVRKLVATGEDLATLKGLRDVLLPLLPLQVEAGREQDAGLLSRLPVLLERHGVDAAVTSVVSEAFRRNESILDALHKFRGDR